ncbi:MAG: family 43 glycosylhydrolase [Blautia sp.]|nr:family 43 glycosylhydrolase [Blautia sp.]
MKKQVFNPYLPLWEYIPDGEPHFFEGRLYIYGSHDRFDGEYFCMNDYVCWSADADDLTSWRYEGVIYRKDQDPRNKLTLSPITRRIPGKSRFPGGKNNPDLHCLWAPDVARGPDGRYYLYYCLDYLPEIGVAVSSAPQGPFVFLDFVQYPDGTLLGTAPEDYVQFDPGVFVDEDGKIYLYSGNSSRWNKEGERPHDSQVMQLCEDMVTLASKPRTLIPSYQASVASGFAGHEFFEASSIRKINGKYYFVYSSLLSHELCYCVSDRPDEGYTYGGTILSIGDIGYQGRDEAHAVNCLGNTHGGIECVNGQWYVFYHRQTNRTQYSRQGCAEKIYFDEKGHIAQVPVTSCGLNDAALHAEGTYPASICCHLTGKMGIPMSLQDEMNFDYPFLTQDGADYSMGEKDSGLAEGPLTLEKPVPYIANVQDGTIIGYKYFQAKAEDVRLTLYLRGRAKGFFTVKTDLTPDAATLGKVEVSIFSTDTTFQPFEGILSLPKEAFSLYLCFEGSGWLDFTEFSFQQANA